MKNFDENSFFLGIVVGAISVAVLTIYNLM